MLFKSLSFHNFGLLAGDQTIDLQTNATGPGGASIVLIGGQNGAGKTTILEALRLCLYGRLAFDGPMSASRYHEYLLSKIHRPKGEGPAPAEASILLEFELTTQGKADVYKIQRSWRRRSEESSKVGENVVIFKNGALLDDVEAEYWQDFIQGLIPSGLSQLFFFDGEQIQHLADDETDTRALGDAVKALLGLEVVERLQSDLAIYVGRELKKGQSHSQVAQLDQAKANEAQIADALNLLEQERASLANEIGRAQREIERVERELMQAGHGLFEDRERLQRKRATLEADASQVERKLAELCEAELPFALCAALCQGLRTQLAREQALVQWQSSRDHVKAFAEQVLKRAQSAGKNSKALETLISASLADAEMPPAELRDVTLMHGLSANAQAEIERWLDEALNHMPNEVSTQTKRLERIQRDMRKTQQALAQVPDQESLKPLMEELFQVQHNLAELTARDAALEGEILEKTKLRALAERAIGKAEGQIRELDAQERRLAYAANAQEALKVFQMQLTKNKLRKLEETFVETFNYLSRKLVVSRVNIEENGFLVELFDEDGRVMPKTQLSAGEKQIYAVSMLWSLAKISGRSLPVVIDTPLGRLDSVHRARLLERYFPEASHQVIILSTDTEIDKDFFRQLQPRVARAFYLQHERGDSVTRVEEGYFWKEPSHA